MSDARHFAVTESLRDGTRVTIRAARADDVERIATAFGKLAKESVYTRFFAYKDALDASELDRLATMDFVRDVMLVATASRADEEIVVGSARYVAHDDAGGKPVAEIAFTVEEDYQGRGLATRLLRHLIRIAQRFHIVRFEADVLAGNKAMLAVFDRSGLLVQRHREDGVVHLTLELTPQA